ncbi:hypothetical protein GCM10010385_68950 [Streptomyces geysiriensis]|nr:hypothetical protein GCM10010385_68950 [Streptomyces geysiriensis]GHC44587.1 hypothetical protein GCM10010308_74820 [Streptomyces vinaceusdrappus]
MVIDGEFLFELHDGISGCVNALDACGVNCPLGDPLWWNDRTPPETADMPADREASSVVRTDVTTENGKGVPCRSTASP